MTDDGRRHEMIVFFPVRRIYQFQSELETLIEMLYKIMFGRLLVVAEMIKYCIFFVETFFMSSNL